MNINENLKNDRKKEAVTRNLDPVIVDLSYTPITISTGCQRLEILDPVIVDQPYTPRMISS